MIAECGVKSDTVIEAFDVVEDGSGGFGPSAEVTAVDQLVFEGAPEGLHGRAEKGSMFYYCGRSLVT